MGPPQLHKRSCAAAEHERWIEGLRQITVIPGINSQTLPALGARPAGRSRPPESHRQQEDLKMRTCFSEDRLYLLPSPILLAVREFRREISSRALGQINKRQNEFVFLDLAPTPNEASCFCRTFVSSFISGIQQRPLDTPSSVSERHSFCSYTHSPFCQIAADVKQATKRTLPGAPATNCEGEPLIFAAADPMRSCVLRTGVTSARLRARRHCGFERNVHDFTTCMSSDLGDQFLSAAGGS